MKRIILILIMAISLGSLSAQECTLRLEMPETMPAIGEEFFVEVWMDVLDYPGYTLNGGDPTLKSGQMGVTFDEAVITPIKTGGPVPLQKYAWNINAMFADYDAKPAEGYPNPGDLRFVSYTVLGPGMDPVFYGGLPLHMWDLKFMYNGGDIEISWQDTDKTTKVAPNVAGGTKEKIVTFWTAWDNVEYAMTYVNYPLPVLSNTWEGDDAIVPDDWFTAENWSTGTVPVAEDVVIPTGLTNYPFIMGGTEATCGALTVETGAFIQLSYDGYLTAMGTTLCDGAIEIMSDETGMGGSFIEAGIDPLSTGTFTYMRNTLGTGALGDAAGWHFISSPVSTFGTDDIWDYYMNYYDEPTSMWVQYGGSPTIPCTPAPNMNMGLMQGWSVKQDLMYEANGCTGGTGQEIDFTGPITSLYSGAQTFTGTAADATGDFLNNWNLIGNPFPATWYYEDMYATGLPAGWDDAMYMYDDVTQNYLSWVFGGGNANDGYVVPTQAVFFHGDGSEATMPMTMDPSELHHSSYSFTKSEVSNLLALKVTGEYSSDETFIRFNEDATLAFDGKYDAYKLMSAVEYVPSLYTHAGDDNLSINSQPETNMVPMSFNTGQNGTFTIEATETSEFSHVVLEDKFTGEQIDLLAGSYTFDFTTGDLTDRFIVHFTPLGIGELGANNVKIWARDNNIIVNVPAEVTGDVVVYNMMGQEVTRTDIVSVETQIPVSDVNTYYVVKVISDSNAVTGKVYIK